MNILCLPAKQLFHYILTGKFKAPSPEWKHQNFQLLDYELIVMTEGVLYLNYNNENFIVKSGEYLLLPPSSSWRQGFKPAYCSFYWLHFTTQSGELPPVLTQDTVLPPRPIFYYPAKRHHPQTRAGRNFNETTAGHRQEQIPGICLGRHVNKHPCGAFWTAHACTARRKQHRKSEADLQ